ncbi:4a-hydroxytetrahydrobiopterin dehydratase [Agromyces albus]|uniref:4a-hydroxytetrahydrobiopterin dehydratase n=1 Tax=Agromyces albus TaxID=205332 RepID=UPI002789E7E8|nr:4a-hydroxytetrahydrobiopterin dehydratase [Agromyces albus]MDQ0574955.1 4a-hydroxytetrahydrobiopterin dehydratase [Agromyces albus]
MDGPSILSPTDTTEDLDGTAFRHAQNHLVGAFTTADFRSAVRLLDAVAVVADELNHHPDVRLGWGRVEFALTSHDVGGVTPRDVELALRIGEIADQLGATTE